MTIGFADTSDSIDNEFTESIVPDEVKEACQEFVEEGALVVFYEVAVWFPIKVSMKLEVRPMLHLPAMRVSGGSTSAKCWQSKV